VGLEDVWPCTEDRGLLCIDGGGLPLLAVLDLPEADCGKRLCVRFRPALPCMVGKCVHGLEHPDRPLGEDVAL